MTEAQAAYEDPQPSRLDRIEAILAKVADRQAENADEIASLTQAVTTDHEQIQSAQEVLLSSTIENQTAIKQLAGDVKVIGQATLTLMQDVGRFEQSVEAQQAGTRQQIQALIDQGKGITRSVAKLVSASAETNAKLDATGTKLDALTEETRVYRAELQEMIRVLAQKAA